MSDSMVMLYDSICSKFGEIVVYTAVCDEGVYIPLTKEMQLMHKDEVCDIEQRAFAEPISRYDGQYRLCLKHTDVWRRDGMNNGNEGVQSCEIGRAHV